MKKYTKTPFGRHDRQLEMYIPQPSLELKNCTLCGVRFFEMDIVVVASPHSKHADKYICSECVVSLAIVVRDYEGDKIWRRMWAHFRKNNATQ